MPTAMLPPQTTAAEQRSQSFKAIPYTSMLPPPTFCEALKDGTFAIREPSRSSGAREFPVVSINASQRRTRWVQRNVTPVAHYARARLSPGIAALSRQVVPMKRFRVELAFRPLRKRTYCGVLANILVWPARAMGRLWEIVTKCLVGSYAHQETRRRF